MISPSCIIVLVVYSAILVSHFHNSVTEYFGLVWMYWLDRVNGALVVKKWCRLLLVYLIDSVWAVWIFSVYGGLLAIIG